MRIKEWYSWHFPELAKIVPDNNIYVRLVDLIGHKGNMSDNLLEPVEEITTDGELA